LGRRLVLWRGRLVLRLLRLNLRGVRLELRKLFMNIHRFRHLDIGLWMGLFKCSCLEAFVLFLLLLFWGSKGVASGRHFSILQALEDSPCLVLAILLSFLPLWRYLTK